MERLTSVFTLAQAHWGVAQLIDPHDLLAGRVDARSVVMYTARLRRATQEVKARQERERTSVAAERATTESLLPVTRELTAWANSMILELQGRRAKWEAGASSRRALTQVSWHSSRDPHRKGPPNQCSSRDAREGLRGS